MLWQFPVCGSPVVVLQELHLIGREPSQVLGQLEVDGSVHFSPLAAWAAACDE